MVTELPGGSFWLADTNHCFGVYPLTCDTPNPHISTPSLIDILHYECMALLSESDPVYPDFFNRVQTKLECCGCVAPADYSKLQSATLPDTCYSGENEVHNTGCLPALYKVSCGKFAYLKVHIAPQLVFGTAVS